MENLGDKLDALSSALLSIGITYVDIIIFAMIIWSIFMGWKRGFIVQIISLSALISGIWLSIRLKSFILIFIKKQQGLEDANSTILVIAFAITFILVLLGTFMLSNIIQAMTKDKKFTTVNRVFASILSFIKYSFFISIFAIFFNKLDVLPKKQSENAFLYKHFQNFAPVFFPYLKFEKEDNN